MTAGADVDAAIQVSAVRLSALNAGALEAWDRLADRAAEPNPFFRREFVQAASAAHGDDPLVLVAARGDDWLLCLPVAAAPRWRRLAVPCLAPWMSDVTYLSTPLIDVDRLEDASRALAEFVAGQRAWAALVLDPVDPDGMAGRALAAAFARVGRPIRYVEWERGALRRRPEATYVEEAMSAKRRKELRRLRRALGRELGGDVAVVDRTHEPSAYDEFLRLEGAGWKGAAGTALASSPERAAFFRAMCRAAAAAGRLQILSLEGGGRTVAMQCNLVDRWMLFGFKVAYDHELARFSPGSLLEVDAIGVFHESESLLRADSCAAPDSELVNRIWPDRRRLQTLIVPTGSSRAALIRPTLAAEGAGRRLVRAVRTRRTRAQKP